MGAHNELRREPAGPLLLATDLDGTFLGGSWSDRARLYELVEENRDRLVLMFCTGRSYASVLQIEDIELIPAPDLLLCDVGCNVLRPGGVVAFPELQKAISNAWADGDKLIGSHLDDYPGLTLQAGTGPYRRSYLYECPVRAGEACRQVTAMGFDGLLSDGRYFDVLPRGVNKGSTLSDVVRRLGFLEDKVLVAGDTLNDLTMLSLGLPAVAVGNAEPALLEALPRTDRLRRSGHCGAGGILDALEHFYGLV